MGLSDGMGLSAADVAAVTGNNNGFGFGGDGAWWLLILFLFAFGGGNWGNGYGGYGGTGAEIQRGFDQSAVISGISGINNAVTNGFSDMAVSQCNQSMNFLTGLNGIQNQIANLGSNLTNTMMSNEMARQNCCCDTKLAIAGLQNTVQTEACADRTSISNALRDVIASNAANTQMILDKMCQQEIDNLKTQNANLQTQINLANLAASQNAQTGQILADNAAQTATLRQALNPTPIPAYVVQNPNGCGCNNFGCGTV